MRKLSEIIEDVLDGKEPPYDEILYSLLVYRALHYFDHRNLFDLYEKPDNKLFGIEYKTKESLKRFENWLNQSPKETVGWNDDPKNPDYLARRNIEKKMFDKFMEK